MVGDFVDQDARGVRGAPQWVAFSGEGHRIATYAMEGATSVIHVLTVSDLSELSRISVPLRGFGRIALSPDGRSLAVEESDCAVGIWDVTTGQRVGTSFGGRENVASAHLYDLAFSPDGASVVSSCGFELKPTGSGQSAPLTGLETSVWDLSSRTLTWQPQQIGRDLGGGGLSFDSQGGLMAAPTLDGQITVFDLAGRRGIGGTSLGSQLQNGETLDSVGFTADGAAVLVITGKGRVLRWRFRADNNVEFVGTLKAPYNDARFRLSQDGKLAVAFSGNNAVGGGRAATILGVPTSA